MQTREEVLLHFGKKGMKWGVRHETKSTGSKGKAPAPKKEPGRIKQELNSLSRERQWKKVARNVGTMKTKDIQRLASRVQMENDLKRLSKNHNIAGAKDKKDYRLRGKMSDQELSRKVTRLRAQDNLHRAVTEASRGQREFGKKVAGTAGTLAVKYALGIPITPKSATKAWNNSSKATETMATDILTKRKKMKSNVVGTQ